jgi:hypothetical protein
MEDTPEGGNAMRLQKESKAKQARREEKRAGRQMAMMGWGDAMSASRHTAELEQRHMSLGGGYHPARSIRGHS